MATSMTSKPASPDSKRRQRHLIAGISAFAGSVISAFLLQSSPAGKGASIDLMLAATLPGSVAGGWVWGIICGFTKPWNRRNELDTNMAALCMILVLPLTAIAAVFGGLGTHLLYTFLPSLLPIMSPETIALYSKIGLTSAGALGGASAALIAHIVWILSAMRKIMQTGSVNGEPSESNDRGDGA